MDASEAGYIGDKIRDPDCLDPGQASGNFRIWRSEDIFWSLSDIRGPIL